jgi:hypothetical protein
MPNGIPALRADECAGDLMAKRDDQGEGRRNQNGRACEGSLPGIALNRPWLGDDRLGARMGGGRDDIARDVSGPTLHPSNDLVSQFINPHVIGFCESSSLLVVKLQVREPRLADR